MIGVASIERWDTIKFDCSKRRQWFKRKGKSLIKGFVLVLFFFFLCFESKQIEVISNTWWLNSAATTHVSNMI